MATAKPKTSAKPAPSASPTASARPAAAGGAAIWGPNVAKAEAGWTQYCGCPLKITVKEEGFAKYEDRSQVRAAAHDLSSIAQYKCVEGPEAKAAYCALKSFSIQAAKPGETTSVSVAAGHMTAIQELGATNWVNDLMITQALDPYRPQRAFMKANVLPAVEKAQADIKAGCGCDVPVRLNLASYAKPRELERYFELEKARGAAQQAGNLGSYCSGAWEYKSSVSPAAIKKAVCSMKAYTIENGAWGKGTHLELTPSTARAVVDANDNEVVASTILETLKL